MTRPNGYNPARAMTEILSTRRPSALDRMVRGVVFGVLATLWGCGGASGPQNGVQQCAPAGTTPRCPGGYTCQSDNHCWKNGTGPGTDGGTGTPTDGGNRTDGGSFATDGAHPQGGPDGGTPPNLTDGAILPNPADGGAPPNLTDAASGGNDGPSGSTDAPAPRDARQNPDLPPPPDVAPPPPPVAPPAGHRMVAAAVVSRSTNYVAFRTLGQKPGSAVMQSTHYRAVRGIVGATQPK